MASGTPTASVSPVLGRVLKLYSGLFLFGVALGAQIKAHLGLNPWEVLHQGIGTRIDRQVGTVAVLLGLPILLLWIPLRQRPGLGTISNMLLVGTFENFGLAVTPEVQGLLGRWLYFVVSLVVCGLGVALYISAGFGPGPRDGVMTGLHRVTGLSIRTVRSAIELVALGLGWLLGGTVGVGTILYALGIGPLVQFFMGVVGQPKPVPDGSMPRVPTDQTLVMGE